MAIVKGNGLAIKGALGLPGTKLEPNLEKIISNPIVDKTIEHVAKKDRIGPNPFLEYAGEQVLHTLWHLDNWCWGPSSPFLWRKTGAHPKLKYISPKHLPEAAKEYIGTLGISIPYHVRSIFFGRDDFGTGDGTRREELSNLQKIKTFLEAAWELPAYLKKVRNKIMFDARKMKATDRARIYLSELAQTKIEPAALAKIREEAVPFVRSFEDVIISGLEERIHDGKSVSDLLKEGGCIIYQNHPSFMGLPLNFHDFERAGIDNVITIAGNNLLNRMRNKAYAAQLGSLLRNSGVLFIERDLHNGRSGSHLRCTLLEEFVGEELDNGNNVLVYCNGGREKGTKEPDSTTVITNAARKASHIIPSAYSHDFLPDGHELASSDVSGHTSFEDLIALIKTDNGGTYHRAFVTYGRPIKPGEYFGGNNGKAASSERELSEARKRIKADVESEIKKLVTFTPAYVLAAAVERLKKKRFTVDELLGNASEIVKYANLIGLPVAPEFKLDSRIAIRTAAEMFAERGVISRLGAAAYEVSGHQGPIIRLYAAKILPVLTHR